MKLVNFLVVLLVVVAAVNAYGIGDAVDAAQAEYNDYLSAKEIFEHLGALNSINTIIAAEEATTAAIKSQSANFNYNQTLLGNHNLKCLHTMS